MRHLIARSVLLFLPLVGIALTALPLAADGPKTKPAARPVESEATRRFRRAVIDSNVDAVANALKGGRSANDRIEGDMPLSIAAGKGNLKIATLLLDHGASADSDNHWGCTALYCATWAHDAPMVQLLLERGAKSQIDNSLAHAAQTNETNVLRVLVDHGVAVNSRNKDGETPLFIAARYDREQAVRMFLEAGADPTIADNEGRTPVAVAKEAKHPEIADLISTFKPKNGKPK